jgi:hypothetical protein
MIGIQFEKDIAPCNALIYFDVSDEVMTQRLIKRGETGGRIDDNAQIIRKRLETFHEETTPILGYYGKQGKLITIDVNRKPEEVFDDVSEAFELLMVQQQVGKQLEFVFCYTFVSVWKEFVFQTDFKRNLSTKGIFLISLLYVYNPPNNIYSYFYLRIPSKRSHDSIVHISSSEQNSISAKPIDF